MKTRKGQLIVVIIVVIVVSVMIFIGNNQGNTACQQTVSRPDYADNSKKYAFDIYREGEDEPYSVEYEIHPREYEESQISDYFEGAYELVLQKLKGENSSLQHVTKNLAFISEIPEYKIKITWKSENYNLVNYNGEVNNEALEDTDKGIDVVLEAEFKYLNYSSIYPINICVYPKERDGRELFLKKITDAFKNAEGDRSGQTIVLPEEIDGKKVYFKMHSENIFISVISFIVVGSIFIAAALKYEKRKKQKEMEQELNRDYPELVSKLMLLTGAGMTIRRAWEKVALDYERQVYCGKCKKRIAYEQMLSTYYKMQSGLSEINAYVSFGRGCNTKEYLKLSSMLEQNLKKGTRGLAKMLEQESSEAFEERKKYARKLGEEAGTKLMLPMGMMLVVVMIIVTVPALLSFHI